VPGLPLTALDDTEQLFHDSVVSFADREVRPRVREMEEQAAIPADLVTRLFDLGLMGIEIPEAHGGAGASFFHAVLAVEALSRVDPALALVVDVHNTLVVAALRTWGTGHQHAVHLPRLASGTVGAYALSEAQSGSDAFALTTRAAAIDGGFSLTGRKLWVSNAAEAGVFIVFATVDPDAGHRGITAFLVDAGSPGLAVGRREHKLGLRASSTCEVTLEDCRVTREAVLGQPGQGYKVAIESLNAGRIGIGAQMVGIATAALGHAIAYTEARQQFGQPVGAFQGVQFQLARAATEVEAARLMVFNAARLYQSSRPFVKEAAMCKLYASEVAERVTSLAVNLLGGNGLTTEYPVEKLYRDAKVGQIYEGTSNMQLLTIARHLRA
jgi:butyryl-CoA dehydrogenase/short/branched chain acyl-CoA dehydrogenase